MKKEHVQEALDHLSSAGERTRAILVVEMTHEGEMRAFKAGAEGDVVIMASVAHHVALKSMTAPPLQKSGAV